MATFKKSDDIRRTAASVPEDRILIENGQSVSFAATAARQAQRASAHRAHREGLGRARGTSPTHSQRRLRRTPFGSLLESPDVRRRNRSSEIMRSPARCVRELLPAILPRTRADAASANTSEDRSGDHDAACDDQRVVTDADIAGRVYVGNPFPVLVGHDVFGDPTREEHGRGVVRCVKRHAGEECCRFARRYSRSPAPSTPAAIACCMMLAWLSPKKKRCEKDGTPSVFPRGGSRKG